MDKQSLLRAITESSVNGEVTQDELLSAYKAGQLPSGTGTAANTQPSSRIAELLAYVGSLVVIVGIAVFIGQQWKNLSSMTKIMVTLGSAFAAYSTAVILHRNEGFEKIGDGFFVISGVLFPMGLFVSLDVLGFRVAHDWTQVLIFLGLSATFLASFFLMKRDVLLLFAILFSSVFFYRFTYELFSNNSFVNRSDLVMYQTLTVGITYIILGWAFSSMRYQALCGVLYFFGVNALLGAVMALGGWEPRNNVWWELAFPIINIALLYASVALKSRSLLVFGALYLIAFISKITVEYFRDSLGWSLSLVFIGFVFMAVSYVSFQLNKRYIR